MNPTVYIDTTIPSYYVDARQSLAVHIERTKEWWENERGAYEVFTSEFVLRELEEGNFPNQQAALELANQLLLLAPDPSVEEIVTRYLENYLMPVSDERDAIHLAFASFYKLDFLLTWNCAHLANVNKRRHIEQVNRRLGLLTPLIVTPLELRLPERRN